MSKIYSFGDLFLCTHNKMTVKCFVIFNLKRKKPCDCWIEEIRTRGLIIADHSGKTINTCPLLIKSKGKKRNCKTRNLFSYLEDCSWGYTKSEIWSFCEFSTLLFSTLVVFYRLVFVFECPQYEVIILFKFVYYFIHY